MRTGVHSTCCELALLTSTLGFQTTLPRGGCMVEVQGCPCLELRQPAPPTPRLSLPPLSWLHSHPRGSPLARAQATCSWLSPDLCCHLRTSVPRVLGVLHPPISAITHSGRDKSTVWYLPPSGSTPPSSAPPEPYPMTPIHVLSQNSSGLFPYFPVLAVSKLENQPWGP